MFFSIPQTSLPVVRRQWAKGKLTVEAYVDDSDQPERGELTFIDNVADSDSLTVRLGATFANESQRLWPPGQYTKIALLLDTRQAVVVPARAVQNGRDGKYLFVVKPGGSSTRPADDEATVEQRSVTVSTQAGTDVVIERGLKAGEVIVTDGQFQLASGAKVRVKSEQPASQPASPAVAEAGR